MDDEIETLSSLSPGIDHSIDTVPIIKDGVLRDKLGSFSSKDHRRQSTKMIEQGVACKVCLVNYKQGGKVFFRDPLLGQKEARDSLIGC